MGSNNRDSSAVMKRSYGGSPDRTVVDVAPRHREIRSAPPKPSTAVPANVIPFAKPRALANGDVTVSKPKPAPPLHLEEVTAPTPRARGTAPPPVVKSAKAPQMSIVAPLPTPPAPAPSALPVWAQPASVALKPAANSQVSPPPIAQLLPATTTVAPLPPPPIAAPIVAAPPKHDPHKWAIYDKLGLGPPKINAAALNKAIVNAYRLLGFIILTIIVIVLVGYIAQQAYFALSDSWIVPMAVSPSDERVVSLQGQVAEQQNQRDKLGDDLNTAERTIASQQEFQTEFARAIKTDLEGRKVALGKIQALANAASSTRAQIRAESSAYAASSNRRMAEEYKAGLIDRNSMLSGKFQVAQISSSNLSLAERQADFETRAAELSQNAKSLDALLTASGGDDAALSYEVLRIKQEYEASKLDLAKSIEQRDTLKAALARQDKLIENLGRSALLRAVEDKATVAFVPYAGLSGAKKGASLYACRLGLLVCHKVGEVLEVLPGEVQFKHPHKDKQLRGQMVEMKLAADEPGAAEDDVLFLGGKPLLF